MKIHHIFVSFACVSLLATAFLTSCAGPASSSDSDSSIASNYISFSKSEIANLFPGSTACYVYCYTTFGSWSECIGGSF